MAVQSLIRVYVALEYVNVGSSVPHLIGPDIDFVFPLV